MIQIEDKNKCCGCAACVQACPKNCISFEEDEHGFRYPLVNKVVCIDCGLCEKVCPCINQAESKKPLKVYAATNPNEEIRMKSSSGGVFSILAEAIIEEGGVVFGARFNEKWEVVHDYTESKEGLDAFRGSKYVQSRIGDTYKQCREFLKQGRRVLFSGTSCQISGLILFLHKEYDNLFTIDVVCHGVPSPKVWRDYLKAVIDRPQGGAGKNTVFSSLNEKPVITGISFRDKSTGWKKYGFVVRGKTASKADNYSVLSSDTFFLVHETVQNNLYMQGFINNLFIRPSCFFCPSKQGKCNSDYSLADFWTIKLYNAIHDDDKGVTLLYIHSEKAIDFIKMLEIDLVDLDTEKELNIAFSKSTKEKYPTIKFWSKYHKDGLPSIPQICKSIKPSLFRLFYNRVISYIERKMS